MRPPAVEKLGYYPTSSEVIEILKSWIAPANDGRLLDPCCGEGSAAGILAKALNCTSWGQNFPLRAHLLRRRIWTVCCLRPGRPAR